MELEKYPEHVINLQIIDNKVVTTSKIIADEFRKEHKNVLQVINAILSEDIGRLNFKPSSYMNEQNKQQPMYVLDRKACVILISRFTGIDSLRFMDKYVDAFDAMESELMKREFNKPRSYGEALLEAGRLAIENEQKQILIEQQSQQLAIAEPKVEYYDNVLQNENLIPITMIAKDIGMTGNYLNKKLEEDGIQYKKGKMWFLTQKYADKGYAHSKTTLIAEKARMGTYWTQLGRKFIMDRYGKKSNVQPNALSKLFI